jgi:hypothetical protein
VANKHRQHAATLARVSGWLGLVAVVLLAGACSHSTHTPDPVAIARSAAETTLRSPGDSVQVDLSDGGSCQGSIVFRDRAVSLRCDPPPGVGASPTTAYQTRFVHEWDYVQIAPGARRPPGLPSGVKWVAFQGPYDGALPIAFSSYRGEAIFELLDAMKAGRISRPKLVGPESIDTEELQFTVTDPPADNSNVTRRIATVSIDSAGRVYRIQSATHFRHGLPRQSTSPLRTASAARPSRRRRPTRPTG